MTTFSRTLLSASVNGKPIPVVEVASPGTLIHKAVDGDGAYDEIYLFAANVTDTEATLTILWGGTTDPTDVLIKEFTISPFSSSSLIASGQVLNGGMECRAFSDTALAINITGAVTRIQ